MSDVIRAAVSVTSISYKRIDHLVCHRRVVASPTTRQHEESRIKMLRSAMVVNLLKRLEDRIPLKVLHRAFCILCIIGFLAQTIQVSREYFKYKTTTRIRTLETESIPVPHVALCTRYTDILDYDQIFRDKGIRLKRTNEHFGITNIHSRLTIRDIFRFTPKVDYLIQNVSLRMKEGFVLYPFDQNINQILNITKFYLQEYVCYRIEVRDNPIIPIKRIIASLHHSRLMMSLSFNSTLSSLDNFMIILFNGPLPSVSRYFSPTCDRLYNFYDTNKIRNYRYFFSQSRNEVHLKEPPYDTHCVPGSFGRTYCMSACLSVLTQVLDRVPFTEIISEPLNLKHINYFDLIDTTRGFIINETYQRCEDKCDGVASCFYDYTLTILAGFARDDRPQHDFQIFIKSPQKPTSINTAEAMISLTEFVVYICSCFDIWFGMSIMSMNPFALWAERKRRRLRKNRVKFISTTVTPSLQRTR